MTPKRRALNLSVIFAEQVSAVYFFFKPAESETAW